MKKTRIMIVMLMTFLFVGCVSRSGKYQKDTNLKSIDTPVWREDIGIKLGVVAC